MLATALASHRAPLRASLLMHSGIDLENLRDYSALDAAQLVIWLPPGCPFWQSFGGPASLSVLEEQTRWTNYWLSILAWQKTEDGQKNRNRPAAPKPIPYASEREAQQQAETAKQSAWLRRQQMRTRALEGTKPDGE